MRQLSRSVEISGLISKSIIPCFPKVLMEVRQALDCDSSDVSTIVLLLGSDSALAARTLKLANSPRYASMYIVTDLSHAVLRIGQESLWNILMTSITREVFCGVARDMFDMHEYFRHCLYTACIAKNIAINNSLPKDDVNNIYISALLHDIGKLVFIDTLPVEYSKVLGRSTFGQDLIMAERERFGFDHAVLGGRLLEKWNIPASITEGVFHHHGSLIDISCTKNTVAYADTIYHMVTDDTQPEGFVTADNLDLFEIMSVADKEYNDITQMINI